MQAEQAGRPNYNILLSRFIPSRQRDHVLETARSYATYANHIGLYDDLVAFLEQQ